MDDLTIMSVVLIIAAIVAVMLLNSYLNKHFTAYANATRQTKAIIILIVFIVFSFLAPVLGPMALVIVGLALLVKFIEFFIR